MDPTSPRFHLAERQDLTRIHYAAKEGALKVVLKNDGTKGSEDSTGVVSVGLCPGCRKRQRLRLKMQVACS